MLVEQSQEGGRLGKQDARLLEGVFEFSEKTAEEVMTPRTEIVALEAGLSVEQAADIVASAQRSRYPVHVDSLDEIIGIVHAKDILKTLREKPTTPVGSIIRPPLMVPGTREVEDVLADMKRLKSHMAVVLDEYGGTAGLVTMEDLLEEIVGPIFDEHDRVERPPVQGAAPDLDASMTVAEFNAEHRSALDDTDYTTLGGFLFGQLGRGDLCLQRQLRQHRLGRSRLHHQLQWLHHPQGDRAVEHLLLVDHERRPRRPLPGGRPHLRPRSLQ